MRKRIPISLRPRRSFAASSVEASGSSATGRKIVAFVAAYLDEHGYPPSVREISRHLGRSLSWTQGHLNQLEADGQVSRKPGRARSLQLHLPVGDRKCVSCGRALGEHSLNQARACLERLGIDEKA